MWGFRSRRRKRQEDSGRNNEVTNGSSAKTESEQRIPNLAADAGNVVFDFSKHISKYIGETVTIFVRGGGTSGLGFTGVLLNANECYIRVITRIGPVPGSTLLNRCMLLPYRRNILVCNSWPNITCNTSRAVNTLGSIACIPIDKIAAFVHT